MKKYINLSFIFAILALASGVFYREFTKFNNFSGRTPLALGHIHFLVLGTVLILLVGFFNEKWFVENEKAFKWFKYMYIIGLPLMVLMFYVRGILVVLGTDISKGASGAISGVAGLSHALVGGALVALFIALLKVVPKTSEKVDN